MPSCDFPISIIRLSFNSFIMARVTSFIHLSRISLYKSFHIHSLLFTYTFDTSIHLIVSDTISSYECGYHLWQCGYSGPPFQNETRTRPPLFSNRYPPRGMDSIAFKGSTAMDQERTTNCSSIEPSLKCWTRGKTGHFERSCSINRKRKKNKENPKESS